MSKIEEVARAIAKAEDDWILQNGDALDGLQEEPKSSLSETMARAGIKAMREPTLEMQIAGAKAPPSGTDTHTMNGKTLIVKTAYNAMIDEVLGHE